jgi:hypothetical protein
MKQFDLIEFIEKLLIPDLVKMAEQQFHYYAFAIICQGIEILGASVDVEPLEKNGMSEQRFKNGLKHFFKDDRYRQNQTKFFTLLRGPLIHQLRPGDGFLLASVCKDNIRPESHLEKNKDGVTVLIIEPFLDDFIKAFESFKNQIAKKNVQAPVRFTDTFLVVSELSSDFGITKWDKNSNDYLTLTPYATGSAVAPKQFPDSSMD